MRLVFAGTPDFAERALAALLAAGHDIALVLTQPDRPAGRGLQPAPSPVKRLAQERGLPFFQPPSLRDADAQKRVADVEADFLVVAAYGLILPGPVLTLARHGAVNIHASLLPRWRGAAPIQRALLAGDRETGITLMRMDEGLDTGPMLAQQRIEITSDDDAGALHDKLAVLGARMIVDALPEIAEGRIKPVAQPAVGVTYARKIVKSDQPIDWKGSATHILRQVRALHPSPGATTRRREEVLKIWRARPGEGRGAPGEVLSVDAGGVCVACGDGAILLTEVQRPGGRRLDAATFQRGFALDVGERLA